MENDYNISVHYFIAFCQVVHPQKTVFAPKLNLWDICFIDFLRAIYNYEYYDTFSNQIIVSRRQLWNCSNNICINQQKY